MNKLTKITNKHGVEVEIGRRYKYEYEKQFHEFECVNLVIININYDNNFINHGTIPPSGVVGCRIEGLEKQAIMIDDIVSEVKPNDND